MNVPWLLSRVSMAKPLFSLASFSRGLQSMCNKPMAMLGSFNSSAFQAPLLQAPQLPQVETTRGLKYKLRVKRRCRYCYFETIDEVVHVQCHRHPCHKQAIKQKKAKNRWIITSIVNKPRREW